MSDALKPEVKHQGRATQAWRRKIGENVVQRAVGGPGVRVRRSGTNISIASSGVGRIRVRAQRMIITSIGDDFIVCRRYDGTTQGTDLITVAKPYQLRQTSDHYKTADGSAITIASVDTQTVTATQGDTSETWATNLPYFVGAEIYAVSHPRGGSGIAGVDWIDLNIDGRKWGVVE